MCDYSLHHVASRPAKVGDKLVSTKFINTPTGGFSAVDNPNVAVCLLPGTEIAFEQDVECQPALGILPSRKVGQRLARFRQVNMDQPCVHHDALEFPDGKIVLVTRLREGQRATVLQMPANARTAEIAAEAGQASPSVSRRVVVTPRQANLRQANLVEEPTGVTWRLCRSDRRIAGGSCRQRQINSADRLDPAAISRPVVGKLMPIGNSIQLLHFPRLAGFRDRR